MPEIGMVVYWMQIWSRVRAVWLEAAHLKRCVQDLGVVCAVEIAGEITEFGIYFMKNFIKCGHSARSYDAEKIGDARVRMLQGVPLCTVAISFPFELISDRQQVTKDLI